MRTISRNLRAGIALAVIGLCACSRVRQPAKSSAMSQHLQMAEKMPSRPVYRYSVIPGGAYSAGELARARRVDKVVEAHYADFGHDATVRTAPIDLYAYISYRKSNRVYWTAKRHRIPKGEAILKDGKNLARARCGNRLSFESRQPTAPGLQPAEDDLGDIEPPEIAVLENPAPPLFYPEYDVPAGLPPFNRDEPNPTRSPAGVAANRGTSTFGSSAPYSPAPYWNLPPGMLLPGIGTAAPASSHNSEAGGSGGNQPSGSQIVGNAGSRISTPEAAGLGLFGGALLLVAALILRSTRSG